MKADDLPSDIRHAEGWIDGARDVRRLLSGALQTPPPSVTEWALTRVDSTIAGHQKELAEARRELRARALPAATSLPPDFVERAMELAHACSYWLVVSCRTTPDAQPARLKHEEARAELRAYLAASPRLPKPLPDSP